MSIQQINDSQLLDDLKQLINDTRFRVATNINSGIVVLNWQVGKRISDEILDNQRSEYGKTIVVTLSRQLAEQFAKFIASLLDFQ